MSEEEVYKNRDIMLGEIHQTTKATAQWCKDHEEEDKKKFFWTWISILIIAAATGVLPQLTAFALEHVK